MLLVHGRGQLGEALLPFVNEYPGVSVYHTWNFLNKSHEVQSTEVLKLSSFIEKEEGKIVFISTSSKFDTPYTRAKLESEKLVLSKSKDNLVLRLPCIIGKGVFKELLAKDLAPYGVVNFISMREAVKFILNSMDSRGIMTCPHWSCSAETLVDLMDFCTQ